MPPIDQLQRLPLIHLQRLERQGIFTTGLLLEVSETPTRRQYLADQIEATTNDVNAWRDEALLLNLASFGPWEQALLTEAGITGLSEIVRLDLDTLKREVSSAAAVLQQEPPGDQVIEGWLEQAKTLEEE